MTALTDPGHVKLKDTVETSAPLTMPWTSIWPLHTC